MVVSLRRMSAGAGYRYLLRTVAAGDGNRALSTQLTRYYAEVGTPPGRWMGSGLAALAGGQIKPGMQVSEDQLALLIGMGRDPVTGAQLGRAYPEHRPLRDRVAVRVAALDPGLSPEERSVEVCRIEAEERAAGSRHAVAGYDLTFSVPKSVSVLWGIADAPVQERIVGAHHAAMADLLDFFEREVAATRAGFAGQSGAVAQIDVPGVAAVAYDHYDSRAGDPQLHTHLVMSNKVMTLRDGRWRSLDGRPVHASVTGLSAHYNAVLMDRLSRDLGVEWELRERGADRNPQWEIAGIGDDLVGEFSSRSRDIDLEKDRLIDAYIERHGRPPSARKIVGLRAQATLATRPPKQVRSLADLTTRWRRRATQRMKRDAASLVTDVIRTVPTVPLGVDDIPAAEVRTLAAEVVAQVGIKRATWTHWNLMAEASRQTMDLRFASTIDREAVVGLIVDAAQALSVRLTPRELATSPPEFQRPDGTSVFRPRHAAKYSSTGILDAEARLLDRSADLTGPSVPARCVDQWLPRVRDSFSQEQGAAVAAIAGSGRALDLLVGPAGAGKTTTMRALREVWAVRYGRGSVVGLAPSAAAAQALADDLGIACDNTAKWLHEHDRGTTMLRAGQLVIVDEATLADTATLDRLTAIAGKAGAKVLLVGDPHQLQSVDAGGAFGLLVDRRHDVLELSELHRFTHAWEKDATMALRQGDVDVIATYARHDRIREGTTEAMLDAAYQGWRADRDLQRTSILVAESGDAVRALNERARAERLIADGAENGREVELADETLASVGDVVITRRNQRNLKTVDDGWVKNGDRWMITAIRRDGAVVVQSIGRRLRGSAVLPASYVRRDLDLGYAVTAHRAQGVTVDTCHVAVTRSSTRQSLYVAMTRGRDSNTAYVATDQPDDSHTPSEKDNVTAHSVLVGILNHLGEHLSATQTIESEQAEHASIARLAAELETIASSAQRGRYIELLRRSGLNRSQARAVAAAPAFGPLMAALRRAEAYGHDLSRLAPRVVQQHRLDDANDVGAVLRTRLEKAASAAPRGSRVRPRLIAGLIPEPLGPMTLDERLAIDERKTLIEQRAASLARSAQAEGEPWIQRLGPPPPTGGGRERWLVAIVTVAAYRDRYNVTSDRAVGSSATSNAQAADRRRAQRAAREAVAAAQTHAVASTPSAIQPIASS